MTKEVLKEVKKDRDFLKYHTEWNNYKGMAMDCSSKSQRGFTICLIN